MNVTDFDFKKLLYSKNNTNFILFSDSFFVLPNTNFFLN